MINNLQIRARNFKTRLVFIYYKYFVLPLIAPGEKASGVKYINLAFNTIHILTRSSFYKIAHASPSTVKPEYNNYQLAANNYPLFKPFVPLHSYADKYGVSFLKLEPLTRLDDEAENKKAAAIILASLKNYGESKKVTLQQLGNAYLGLIIARKYLAPSDFTRLTNYLQLFLENNAIRIGPVHYDFHPKNIMQTIVGEPKVIDFDCFNTQGIQAIDELYYQIEKQAQTKGYPWIPYLLDYCGNDKAGIAGNIDWPGDKRILALLYFLNRIGQENHLFGIVYSADDILKLNAIYV